MRAQMPGASLTEMVDAALGGNAAAQRVFEDAGLHLGWGLAVAANLLNPGVIIVGGDPKAVRRLGFRPASTMQDALEMASDHVGREPTITHAHNPPLFLADVK